MASQTSIAAPPKTLREAIAHSQLTTEQIVAKVGCTRKSLSNWKNGVRPRDYYIGRLSEVLGAELWPLYGGTQEATAQKQAEEPIGGAFFALPRGTILLPGESNFRMEAYGYQHVDHATKLNVSRQLSNLWDQFHTTEEAVSIEALRLAATSHTQLVMTLAQWPLADRERSWAITALADASMLLGRLARDQLNYQEAIAQ